MHVSPAPSAVWQPAPGHLACLQLQRLEAAKGHLAQGAAALPVCHGKVRGKGVEAPACCRLGHRRLLARPVEPGAGPHPCTSASVTCKQSWPSEAGACQGAAAQAQRVPAPAVARRFCAAAPVRPRGCVSWASSLSACAAWRCLRHGPRKARPFCGQRTLPARPAVWPPGTALPPVWRPAAGTSACAGRCSPWQLAWREASGAVGPAAGCGTTCRCLSGPRRGALPQPCPTHRPGCPGSGPGWPRQIKRGGEVDHRASAACAEVSSSCEQCIRPWAGQTRLVQNQSVAVSKLAEPRERLALPHSSRHAMNKRDELELAGRRRVSKCDESAVALRSLSAGTSAASS